MSTKRIKTHNKSTPKPKMNHSTTQLMINQLGGLEGSWADDKEKFKSHLLGDIKTMLFGNWKKPWKASVIFGSDGKPILGFRSIHGKTYRNDFNILSLSANAGRSPFFCTLEYIRKQKGKITNKEKITYVNGFIPFQELSEGHYKITWDKPDFILPKSYRVINTDFVSGIKKPVYKVQQFEKKELNLFVENIISVLKSKKRIPGVKYDQADKCFFRYTPDFSKEGIHLVKIDQFESIEEYYSTLFHEIIHSTKNPKRLGRGKLSGRKINSYAAEELVAEMGAAIICAELSLSYDRQNSITYLKGWLKSAQKKEDHTQDEILLQAYGYAVEAVEYLLEDIELEKLVPQDMILRAKAPALSKGDLSIAKRFYNSHDKERHKITLRKIKNDTDKRLKVLSKTKNSNAILLEEISEKSDEILNHMDKKKLTHIKVKLNTNGTLYRKLSKVLS